MPDEERAWETIRETIEEVVAQVCGIPRRHVVEVGRYPYREVVFIAEDGEFVREATIREHCGGKIPLQWLRTVPAGVGSWGGPAFALKVYRGEIIAAPCPVRAGMIRVCLRDLGYPNPRRWPPRRRKEK